MIDSINTENNNLKSKESHNYFNYNQQEYCEEDNSSDSYDDCEYYNL